MRISGPLAISRRRSLLTVSRRGCLSISRRRPSLPVCWTLRWLLPICRLLRIVLTVGWPLWRVVLAIRRRLLLPLIVLIAPVRLRRLVYAGLLILIPVARILPVLRIRRTR